MSADAGLVVPILIAIIAAATPFLLAATGELVVERAGVLNLGIEGMMLVGAIGGFAAVDLTGSGLIGLVVAALAGALLAAVFGLLTLVLLASQVASGLALTIFGIGLSALVGASFVGEPVAPLGAVFPDAVRSLPVIGPVLLGHDILVYVSIAAILGVWWGLAHTRTGLIIRAIGDSHDAAHNLGYPVVLIRFGCVLFGGAMAGLAGAYLSLVHTPLWQEGMTAGRGWIALAIIVFATWRPLRVLAGAYLFGAVWILQLHAQGIGIAIPSQFLNMLPYLATLVVLVLISRDARMLSLNAPASLGKPFSP